MSSHIERPWALLTGASEGIGEGFALQLDQRKTHNIVLIARTEEKLKKVASKLNNVEYKIVVEDLASAGAAERIVEKTKDLKVSLLINNAGMAPGGYHEELDYSIVQKTMALNMTTPTELIHLLLPEIKDVRESLREQQKASKYGLSGIINVSSMSAFFPIPSMALYASTKAYLLSLSESLYQEQRNNGFDVPIVCTMPGPVQSEIWTKEGASSGGLLIPMDTVEHVVGATLGALDSNRPLIIPGYLNNLTAFLCRFGPRSLNRYVSRRAMGQDPLLRSKEEFEETIKKHGVKLNKKK